MGMFCYQCQETARNTGCNIRGVCGKTEEVSNLQDLLIYTLRGIGETVVNGKLDVKTLPEVNYKVLNGLFMTITNANFDDKAIVETIKDLIKIRDDLYAKSKYNSPHDAVTYKANTREEMLAKAASIGLLAEENEDVRSLKYTVIYGLKGMAAYTEHAENIGEKDLSVNAFIYKALAMTLREDLTVDQLVALVLETGEYGVKSMALIDRANTGKYGHPIITKVNIGVRKNPAILITGHDLPDLERLLEQTKGTGVDVYTHGEMLPAHYYPFFRKYDNLVGNYGNAWWKQVDEFGPFHGPILFTTNCIVPPRSEEIRARIFTTGSTGYPGCKHIVPDKDGNKDFSEVIEMAKKLPSPEEIETGYIVGGFAHNQTLALADKVIEAVKSGAIKKFFVMAGCDGRMKSRDYYTKFAQALPKDTVILTAGCAKYRYNKLNLGDINGIPRVLDAGQCNDSYSLVLIALALKEAFGLKDVNDLPIAFNIAWYEQKAVIVLLSLLYLGIKNIHLGPTLPGFLSANVAKVLVEKFGIAGIGTVEDDINLFLK
ncbi:MAG: hydroxylamine reductase [Clostridia bacterium]|nr:hydroxylamine reductase [Clostridia bacterium]